MLILKPVLNQITFAHISKPNDPYPVAYTHFKAQETQILMLSTNLKVHM
jgi:hypothetical protein